jgi:hypothetical protein
MRISGPRGLPTEFSSTDWVNPAGRNVHDDIKGGLFNVASIDPRTPEQNCSPEVN